MVLGLTVQDWAHWIHKEMQNNEHVKHTILCLLFITPTKFFKRLLAQGFILEQAQVLVGLSFGHELQSCLQRKKLPSTQTGRRAKPRNY